MDANSIEARSGVAATVIYSNRSRIYVVADGAFSSRITRLHRTTKATVTTGTTIASGSSFNILFTVLILDFTAITAITTVATIGGVVSSVGFGLDVVHDHGVASDRDFYARMKIVIAFFIRVRNLGCKESCNHECCGSKCAAHHSCICSRHKNMLLCPINNSANFFDSKNRVRK